MPLPTTSSVAAPDRAASGRDRSGNMPATTSKATVQMVANAANQSSATQFGSMACHAMPGRELERSYSAGVANPVGCPAMPGFGVREVLRMLVLTKRVS